MIWHLHEHRHLLSATAFHATSAQEADDIRRAGFLQPIAILPNGVRPPSQPEPPRSLLFDTLPKLPPKRIALFMSRLHPKKGPVELIQAWSSQPPSLLQDWHLVLAGPDLDHYRPAILHAISQSAQARTITLLPEVSGALKHALLHHAELFVLPTHEENFGNVIAESLAHATPVLTTRRHPGKFCKPSAAAGGLKTTRKLSVTP
ncbi:MAG: glycosyltransferase [Blastochloris sp.]|nr:glycosyltransferase [Blastochloris sp.]